MDGPVVTGAKTALALGNVELILPFVPAVSPRTAALTITTRPPSATASVG